ncbi:hypothetical protein OUZ56_014975 [Daphnia magna]|uniref:Uncharacterized protein n=1 Tax=Daphnia magna TaxID=35525 RepID=A0ABR0ALF6_9CRUS|nr:hypothetical protein OUZ56_014975 [Daphnia magna]
MLYTFVDVITEAFRNRINSVYKTGEHLREDKDIKDYGTNLFHYNNPVYWFILSNHERFGNVVLVEGEDIRNEKQG